MLVPMRWAIVLLVLFCGCGNDRERAEPATAAPSALEAQLETLRNRHELVALAAAEMRDGAVTREAAVGRRRIDERARIALDDRWHLGSCTKPMTAALLAQLVDAGRIRFTTTLGEIFVDVAIHPLLRAVTLHMLLAHRGGLAHDSGPEPEARAIQGPPRQARAELARRLIEREPAYRPDTETRYANFGYVIVAAALERVLNRTWEELMREHLFSPLGMQSCGFGMPDAVGGPSGHVMQNGRLRAWARDNPPHFGPAGAVHCSLRDWARFADWLIAHAEMPTHQPLLQPTDSGFAAGARVEERAWAERPVLTCDGSNGAFFATMDVDIARRRAFFATTNAATDGASNATHAAITFLATQRIPR